MALFSLYPFPPSFLLSMACFDCLFCRLYCYPFFLGISFFTFFSCFLHCFFFLRGQELARVRCPSPQQRHLFTYNLQSLQLWVLDSRSEHSFIFFSLSGQFVLQCPYLQQCMYCTMLVSLSGCICLGLINILKRYRPFSCTLAAVLWSENCIFIKYLFFMLKMLPLFESGRFLSISFFFYFLRFFFEELYVKLF